MLGSDVPNIIAEAIAKSIHIKDDDRLLELLSPMLTILDSSVKQSQKIRHPHISRAFLKIF